MRNIGRTIGISALVVLGFATAACDRRSNGAADEAAQLDRAERSANAAVVPKGSIMRPSVVNETEPAPAPTPAPEPLRAEIYFGSGEASLGEDARKKLDAVIEAAAAAPSAAISVRGHSDSKGDAGDNLLMSARRANAVRDYLVEKGVSAPRIATAALGEPAAAPPTEQSEAEPKDAGDKARRVEIVIEAPTPGAG